MSTTVHDLPTQWRDRANDLRKWAAADGAATAWEAAATELERTLLERDDEVLTLTAAAQESSYSADHLGRLVREGKIANAGRPNAPRVRRGDLPIKAGDLPIARGAAHIGRAEIARAVINRHAGGAR